MTTTTTSRRHLTLVPTTGSPRPGSPSPRSAAPSPQPATARSQPAISVQRPDRDARLRELIDGHGPALIRATLRWTNADRQRAEDVVQETWVRAWKHLDELIESRGSVRGWLLRVAHNIAVDQHRSRAARPSEVGLDERFDAPVGGQAIEPVEEMLSELAVRNLLAGLPEPIRLALEQVYLRDRTATEAGRALGIPAGTVKSRVHYGIALLRSTSSGHCAA